MAIQVMTEVFERSRATLGARLVLLAIADCADKETRAGWPSVAYLAKASHLSETSVHFAIRRLVEMGELIVERRPGTSNVYRVAELGGASSLRGADSAGVQEAGGGGVQEACTGGVQAAAPGTVSEPSLNHQGERAKKPRARRWRVVPPDTELTDDRRRMAREEGMKRDEAIEFEWRKFKRHEFNSPRSDVDRTWQNWCAKEAAWNGVTDRRDRARAADRDQEARARAAERRSPSEPTRLSDVEKTLAMLRERGL